MRRGRERVVAAESTHTVNFLAERRRGGGGDAGGNGADAPLSTRQSKMSCICRSRQGGRYYGSAGRAGQAQTPLSEHVDVIVGGAKRWRFHREALLALLASAPTHSPVRSRRHLHRVHVSSMI
jgi:hypothetical protein